MLHDPDERFFWTSVHTTLHFHVFKPDKKTGRNLLNSRLSEYNVDITTFNLRKNLTWTCCYVWNDVWSFPLPWCSLNKGTHSCYYSTTHTHIFTLLLSPLGLISGCYISEWALSALQCSGCCLMPANVQLAKRGMRVCDFYGNRNNSSHVTCC